MLFWIWLRPRYKIPEFSHDGTRPHLHSDDGLLAEIVAIRLLYVGLWVSLSINVSIIRQGATPVCSLAFLVLYLTSGQTAVLSCCYHRLIIGQKSPFCPTKYYVPVT